jgi:hypothetical protein
MLALGVPCYMSGRINDVVRRTVLRRNQQIYPILVTVLASGGAMAAVNSAIF